ncbi:MAG: IS701 family transposase (plasmid) [Leptolyngbya sp. BL-A-14]
MSTEDVEQWSNEFVELNQRIAPYFKRLETKQHAQDYLQGLLSAVERKNSWQIAEQVGDANPYAIQHLLGRSVWDADLVRNELRDYVVEHLGHDNAVVVIDETGFLKKGNQSVGVQRQYSGTAGRIENCQIGVFLSYATPDGYTFLDRELYLPKSWTDEPERCGQAGVPDTISFATKPQLARQMLQRLFEAHVPHAWVSGDEVYGSDRRLRLWLEEQGEAYVLAVSVKEPLWIGYEQYRADEVAANLTDCDWVRLSCGDGTKGPRTYDWAMVRFNCPSAPDWQRWLLVRRSVSDPIDLAYYVVFAPTSTTLAEIVSVAGTRWTIETGFETAKGEVGLDHYEVRSWQGWYRHMTLSLVAHAFLSVARAQTAQQGSKKGDLNNSMSPSINDFKRKHGLKSP